MGHESEIFLLEKILLDIECFSIILSIILLVVYWKRSDKNKFLICYTFYQVFVISFVFSHIMKHLNQGLNLTEVYFSYIKNISFLILETICTILLWTFTNPQKKFDKKIILLSIGPMLLLLLIITNNWHGLIGTIIVTKKADTILVKTDLCIAIEYFICISAAPFIFICFKKLIKMRGYQLIQGTLILLALLVPLLLYGYRKILNCDLIPSLEFDPVPTAISISTILLAIAALKYKVINLIPIAFKEFAESIGVPLVILDNLNRIQYYNNTFLKIFSSIYVKKQQHIDHFLQQLENNSENQSGVHAIKAVINSNNFTNTFLEVCLHIPETTYYKISMQSIKAYRNEQVGMLVSFNDITGYKNLIATEAELAATKARFEISRDAHDIIGYSMTHIIIYLQTELANLSEEELRQRSNTINALKIAKEKTQEIRELLYKNFKNVPTYSDIKCINFTDKLLCRLKNIKESLPSGINMFYNIDSHIVLTDEKCFNVLDMICLEGVNNSLKHGHAQNIQITLKYSDCSIRLKIFDDGKGCETISKGLGLKGIEDRIYALKGSLNFINEPSGGFGIFVNIPISKGAENSNGVSNII